MVGSELKSV